MATRSFKTRLRRRHGLWCLHVGTPEGLWLEYRYASLPQARFFAAVFVLGPTSFPRPYRSWFRGPTRRSRMAGIQLEAVGG